MKQTLNLREHREIIKDCFLSTLRRKDGPLVALEKLSHFIRCCIHSAGLYFHSKSRFVITPTSLTNVPDLNSVTNYRVSQFYFNSIKFLFQATSYDPLNHPAYVNIIWYTVSNKIQQLICGRPLIQQVCKNTTDMRTTRNSTQNYGHEVNSKNYGD